ncbi:peroxisomal biogenesis factor 11 [Cokeromyces recurvatus]|uniref:peroxisomal biogenesis factor 11 n=1 Tax=Cokeromyces recurvatus TaxID=90255 RepID=UPI00221E3808|nr:peroxisomal biogenesis factor 11 [Cokeromyces recurvatus]KAI7902185.1 peroxisomal biogenesis factor 11 [Cokeromyces recurvatus]
MILTHQRVDAFNRYLNTTVGREKLCRLIQYFARFYAFYLFRNGAPKDVIQRWVDLKTHLGNGRKFFRLLKPVEFAQTGIKSLALNDEILRFTAVAKQAGMFLYYISEAFVLSNAINFYKPANIKQITELGQKCWFAALIASLISSVYKFKQLSVREHMLEKSRKAIVNTEEKSETQIAELKAQESALAKDKYNTKYAFIQDAVDIIIPSTSLGYLKVDEGIVGLAGMTTSFMAMVTQWNKLNG